MKKCCICEKKFEGYGHNPEPITNKGRCCDDCNSLFVIPARINQLAKRYDEIFKGDN